MNILKNLLADLVKLRAPVTAAAVVALVVTVVPGVHINAPVVAGILVGVGVIANFVEQLVMKPSKAVKAKTLSL